MRCSEPISRLTRITRAPRLLIVSNNNMVSFRIRNCEAVFADLFREIGWTVQFLDIRKAAEDTIVKFAAGVDAVCLLEIPSLALINNLLLNTRARIIFYLTDAFWVPHRRQNGWQDLEAILRCVHAVLSDNEFVAAYARRYNCDVQVIPACMQVEPIAEARKSVPKRNDDRVVIGWVGTANTVNALNMVQEPLKRLSMRNANLYLRLLVLNLRERDSLQGFKHFRYSVLPDYDEDKMIREVLRMDIGIVLPAGELDEYAVQGPLQALIYMAAGVTPVCQNAGYCANLIHDGKNGMLASNLEEWEWKLDTLITSGGLRTQISRNAFCAVESNHTLKSVFDRLVDAIRRVLNSASHSRGTVYEAGDAYRAMAASPSPTQDCDSSLSIQRGAKRVLIACSHFWPSIGGVENRMEHFGIALVKMGFEVTVLTADFPGRHSNVRNGIRIQSVDTTKLQNGIPALQYAVRKAVISGEYNACILVQDPLGNIIWSIEGVVPPPGTRLIIQPIINSDGYSKWKDHAEFRNRLAAMLNNASVTVAMTRSGPDNEFMRSSGIVAAYIPNATTVPEPAGDFRKKYGIDSNQFLVLHVANLYLVKNHVGLLDALHDLPGSWQLAMVGKPSGEPQCIQAVHAKLAKRPDVLYIPGLTREWVSAAMEAADVIVLSSFGEGSPNTILEAMAHGKPWLATPECGAANEHAGGIICGLSDFREYLTILHDNPKLCQSLGELGHRHWQESYSWDTVIKGWIDIIETGVIRQSFTLPESISRSNKTLVENVKERARKLFPLPKLCSEYPEETGGELYYVPAERN